MDRKICLENTTKVSMVMNEIFTRNSNTNQVKKKQTYHTVRTVIKSNKHNRRIEPPPIPLTNI